MAFLRTMRRLLSLALIAWVGLALLLVYIIPRLPPQDLPWTPLDLDAPIGLATANKIANIDGAACRTLLDQAGIHYRVLADTRRAECGFDDGIRWAAGGRRDIRYAPPAPPLACPIAAALVVWEREVVQPAAEQRLGATRGRARPLWQLFMPTDLWPRGRRLERTRPRPRARRRRIRAE
jgi:hypothetical protein